MRSSRSYILTIIVAIACSWVARTWVLEPYRIPSEAMFPALLPGDTVLVNKLTYSKQSSPGNLDAMLGDLVVFESPRDRGKQYIKRIVGLPGQKIRIEEGALWINGTSRTVYSPQDSSKGSSSGDPKKKCGTESLANQNSSSNTPILSYEVCAERPTLHLNGEIQVPVGHVFVVGDLRSSSLPGGSHYISAAGEDLGPRGWGIIPVSKLVGRAEWVWLSVSTDLPNSSLLSRIRWSRFLTRLNSRK